MNETQLCMMTAVVDQILSEYRDKCRDDPTAIAGLTALASIEPSDLVMGFSSLPMGVRTTVASLAKAKAAELLISATTEY